MNILKLSPAYRLMSLVAAIFIAATLFVGAAATAQTRASGAFYTATLTTPAATPRTVAGSLIWNCAGTACNAARGTSRPAIVCARLVRTMGPVTSFVAEGRALEADDLAKCNAVAG